MKRKTIEIIEEAEYLKDIYWWIQGALETEGSTKFTKEHADALQVAFTKLYEEKR